MSTSIAYKHYLRAFSRWPKDALRPERQLQDVIRRRVDRQLLPPSATAATQTQTQTQAQKQKPSAAPWKPVDEKAQLEQVNAMYSLLENRYSRKFPLTGSLMKPASRPTHYADLAREMEEAPKRTWWERTKLRWKGMLRFS